MIYAFVVCTVASVCLFVRAYIVDMVEDKMLSRFFLLLGIAMLMAGMGVSASLWSLPFLAVIPVSVIVYWHTRWRAKGKAPTSGGWLSARWHMMYLPTSASSCSLRRSHFPLCRNNIRYATDNKNAHTEKRGEGSGKTTD